MQMLRVHMRSQHVADVRRHAHAIDANREEMEHHGDVTFARLNVIGSCRCCWMTKSVVEKKTEQRGITPLKKPQYASPQN
jgi:hypothetical protein